MQYPNVSRVPMSPRLPYYVRNCCDSANVSRVDANARKQQLTICKIRFYLETKVSTSFRAEISKFGRVSNFEYNKHDNDNNK